MGSIAAHNKKTLKRFFEFLLNANVGTAHMMDILQEIAAKHSDNVEAKTLATQSKEMQRYAQILSNLLNEKRSCNPVAKGVVEMQFFEGMYKLCFDQLKHELKMYMRSAQENQWVEIKHKQAKNIKNENLSNVHALDWLCMPLGVVADMDDHYAISEHRAKFDKFICAVAQLSSFDVLVDSHVIKDFTIHNFDDHAVYSFREIMGLHKGLSQGKSTHIKLGADTKIVKMKNDALSCIENYEQVLVNAEQALIKDFTSLFGEDWMRLYSYLHSTFSLKHMREFIQQFRENKEKLLQWEQSNPVTAMMLIRTGCTADQINNNNIFSYDNLLSANSPFFPFEKKAQIRHFMKLPVERAKLFYLYHYIEYAKPQYQTYEAFRLRNFANLFEQAQGMWKVAIKWVEHPQVLEQNDLNVEALAETVLHMDAFHSCIDHFDAYKVSLLFNLLLEEETAQKERERRMHRDAFGAHHDRLALTYFMGMSSANSILDFATSRNAYGTDWNINSLTSKTTYKRLTEKIQEWHNDLQEVDYQKLMEDDSRLESYYTHPDLKRLITTRYINGATFVPITTNRDLFLEGREMNHCVYSMHEDVSGGELCVFQGFLGSERVTLSLEVIYHHKKVIGFKVDQCQAYENSDASVEIQEISQRLAEILEAEALKKVQKIS